MPTTTLQTIANLVHYSRSTVSRVLNDQWNEHGISEATAKGIIDCGLRIPEDVSIIGFDDFETATMLPIRLTVVRQPIEKMALCTVDLLLSRIDKTNTHSFVTKILKTELILRQ